MAGVTLKLDRRFRKQAKGIFERYYFDVGILEDKPHKLPAPKKAGAIGPGSNLKAFAGGPARKTGRKSSGKTIAEVSEDLRKRLGINFYTHPFKSKKNKEILRFTREFFKIMTGQSDRRRISNLLQAIVRNPILRGDYGSNSPVTSKIKGFNRLMIDTGQVFNAIKAKVIPRVSK